MSPQPHIGDQPRDAQAAPRDPALPWSITLPVAAGVFLGALLLGLLLLAYANGQKNSSETAAAAPGQGRAQQAAATIQPTASVATTDAASLLPRLPGLIEANRLQLKRACIGGTVGHRRSNGWVQAVADNAPRRCVATTQ